MNECGTAASTHSIVRAHVASLPSSQCCTVFSFFFFQAADGIRDRDVTGVHTCALPISRHVGDAVMDHTVDDIGGVVMGGRAAEFAAPALVDRKSVV